MTKDPLCVGCALIDCPGPVHTEFSESAHQPDVYFLGEAPGYSEIQQGRPMVGEAGRVLRHTIAYLQSRNELQSYAIGNVWRCRPTNNKLPEDADKPAEYCQKLLREELSKVKRIAMPLGGTALNALTSSEISITGVQRHLFSVTLDNGRKLPVLAAYHPSYINRRGSEWRDWELAFDKLVLFLKGGSDFIPESMRIVHKAVSPNEALAYLKRVKELSQTTRLFACDIETSAGYSPWAGARIISVSISWSPAESVAMMWEDIEDAPGAFELLKSLLEDESLTWDWFNGQYDTIFFRAAGINPRIGKDEQLSLAVIDERRMISLKEAAGVFIDAPNWERDIELYAPKKEDDYSVIPHDKLLQYNGLDTVYTRSLASVFDRYLDEEGMRNYCERILYPTYDLLAYSRFVGIRVDMYKVKELQSRIQPVLDELEHEMATLTGNAFFNPRSPPDKLKALHDRGLMVVNTRKETLEPFTGDELVDLIRDFMDASKILDTYVTGLANVVYEDLRVHPDWKTPTENSRPRCGEPNLLGMPRKADIEEHKWKRYVKEQFIADPGTLFMHLDRRQSEVRCEVFLAKALSFIETLRKDSSADIHGMFTKILYGEGYTKEQRVLVKMIVFGLIYNREAPSLAKQFTAIERQNARKLATKLGKDFAIIRPGRATGLQIDDTITYRVWTVSEAQRFINDFFKLFPELLTYRDWCMKTAAKEGKLVDFLGRVRHFGLVNQDNRHHVMNEAVNFPPSSLSAGINFLSCIETRKQYGKYGVVVLVPVHDSALVRFPKDSKDLPSEMQGMWERLAPKVVDFDIPFPCDVTVGERWSDL